METPEFLGQDLMRSAFKKGSLKVFKEPAKVMRDTRLTDYARADAFKAIRHGLAAIPITGWQESLTEPLEVPVLTDDPRRPIRHRLASDYFPPHESELIEHNAGNATYPRMRYSQGGYALAKLSIGLSTSFAAYIEPGQRTRARGISVDQTFNMLFKYVSEGHKLGLFAVPDAYAEGEFLHEGFHTIVNQSLGYDLADIRQAVRSSAANPIRFARTPIEALMEDEQTASLNQLAVRGLMRRIVIHNTRVSQQHSFNGRTVNSDRLSAYKLFEKEKTRLNPHGFPEVTWTGHDSPLLPYHQRGQSFAEDLAQGAFTDEVFITKRNKCPAGYTREAGMPMGLQIVSDACIGYLVAYGLDVPKAFNKAKEVQYI